MKTIIKRMTYVKFDELDKDRQEKEIERLRETNSDRYGDYDWIESDLKDRLKELGILDATISYDRNNDAMITSYNVDIALIHTPELEDADISIRDNVCEINVELDEKMYEENELKKALCQVSNTKYKTEAELFLEKIDDIAEEITNIYKKQASIFDKEYRDQLEYEQSDEYLSEELRNMDNDYLVKEEELGIDLNKYLEVN